MKIKYHYLNQENQPQGPLDKAELQKLYQSGGLFPYSLVAEEGGEWATLESINLFDLERKDPFNFKKFLWNLFKYPLALCFILIALGGVLYFAGIIDKSTFQSKPAKYTSLVADMKSCRGEVDQAIEQVLDGKISAHEFSKLLEKQLKPLKEIDKQFKKLGIPERDLQVKLLSDFGELKQQNHKLGIALENGIIDSATLDTYFTTYAIPLKRIVEDYLYNDEDLKTHIR